jgi:chlorobactene glucosyltransferase
MLLLSIAFINMLAARNLRDYKKQSPFPRISVLVPARNEESKIAPCVNSLLSQDYPDFQVIVLDDNSTDRTGEILASLAQNDSRLKVIRGTPLPYNWLGKHWACHQLYKEADGELLMFTDADTTHTPNTLTCAAGAIHAEQADMISIIPRHLLGTWSEKLIMPIFALGVFAQVPLLEKFRPNKRTTLSSSGKLMMFRRKAYETTGGFEAIKENVLDDLELPQQIIARGFRYRLLDGTDNVSTRMYHTFDELYEGLTKNSFAAYNYNIPLFVLTWLWMLFAFWEPLLLIAIYKDFAYPPVLTMGLSIIAVIASLLLWAIYYHRFKFPIYMIFLYPLSITAMAAVSISSMVLTLSGRTTWKDRRIPTRRIY